VNSLRLLGHREPISVLDLGLTDAQRAALAPECDIVPVPPGAPRHPWLLEPVACLARPAEVVVYIDADVIVTQPLNDLIERARVGGVVVFPDALPDRWFAEWHEIFDLAGPARRQTYVNAGCFAVSTRRFPALLPRWLQACERIVGRPTALDDRREIDTPVGFSSQDAWNALLMSEIPAVAVDLQPVGMEVHRSQLPLVEVRDVRTLDCRLDGQAPTLLHHWGEPKPWESWTHRDAVNAYSTCLRRLLAGSDVAVRIDRREIPRWLRPGPVGAIARRIAGPVHRLRRQPGDTSNGAASNR
jgi:hypothetical protein